MLHNTVVLLTCGSVQHGTTSDSDGSKTWNEGVEAEHVVWKCSTYITINVTQLVDVLAVVYFLSPFWATQVNVEFHAYTDKWFKYYLIQYVKDSGTSVTCSPEAVPSLPFADQLNTKFSVLQLQQSYSVKVNYSHLFSYKNAHRNSKV